MLAKDLERGLHSQVDPPLKKPPHITWVTYNTRNKPIKVSRH
jgi:hypothetical protein